MAGGTGFTAKVTVTNNGPSDSGSDWTASATLPSSDLAFGSMPLGCTVDGTGLVATCGGSDLIPNGSTEFDLPISAPHDAAIGDYQVSAAVQPGSVSEGTNTNPDSDQASVHIDNVANLGVTLANSPSSGIVAGQDSFTTAATVSNAGPSDSHAYSVTYSITGGSGLSFASSGQPAGCSPSGATLVCGTNPDLTPSGPGSSAVLPDVTINTDAGALGDLHRPRGRRVDHSWGHRSHFRQ